MMEEMYLDLEIEYRQFPYFAHVLKYIFVKHAEANQLSEFVDISS